MGHRNGESRHQAALFPVMLDELVAPGALVRVVDAWVGSLNMARLGFAKSVPQVTGRPPYDPADLLKLYVWGYLNALRSSRALERECQRNVECMWLLGRLCPDHKTIAEFRRLNAQRFVAVCAAFVEFARDKRLLGGTQVAVDGTKLRAVASRSALKGKREFEAQAKRNAEQIREYLRLLDDQDQQDAGRTCDPGDVQDALKLLKAKGEAIQQELQELMSSGSEAKVHTEPDARPMKSLDGAPGYNLQAAVDTKSHLIVHHAVVQDRTDRQQLEPMAVATQGVLNTLESVIADAGYANGDQIASLDEARIISYVAPNRSVNPHGLLDKSAFSYDAEADRYTCPAGQALRRKKVCNYTHKVIYAAKPADCGSCPMKPSCTSANYRSVTRHFNEDALEASARRWNTHPEMAGIRRQVAEHPFGTIKDHILRNARLVMRGLKGAAAECSLAVLAYNIKRACNLNGAAWMQAAARG
jgi:transposase